MPFTLFKGPLKSQADAPDQGSVRFTANLWRLLRYLVSRLNALKMSPVLATYSPTALIRVFSSDQIPERTFLRFFQPIS